MILKRSLLLKSPLTALKVALNAKGTVVRVHRRRKRGGPGGPWPPQIFIQPHLRSEHVQNYATSTHTCGNNCYSFCFLGQ